MKACPGELFLGRRIQPHLEVKWKLIEQDLDYPKNDYVWKAAISNMLISWKETH